MKKLQKFIQQGLIAMAFVLTVLTAVTPSVQAASLVDEIKDRGKLTIGTSADYPPYEWILAIDGKDEYVGFEIEVAQAIADKLGVELEISNMDFDGVLPALESGKVDLAVAGITPTAERQKAVDFTLPLLDDGNTNYLIVREADKDKWTSADQIDEMSVAVQKGTIQEQWLMDSHPKADINSLGKQTDAFMALGTGRCDAILVTELVADIYLEHQDGLVISDIEVSGIPAEDVSIALKKGNEDFLAFINEVLEELKAEGKIKDSLKEATRLMIENGELQYQMHIYF